MLSFGNDYSYGACPEILDRLARTNDMAFPGYGSDAACEDAKRRIREACETPDADVWFLVGGTQTNQTVIDTMLAPYEGVVTVDSGHPNVHEAGAIESTGHKVITLPHHAGTLDAAELDDSCATFYAYGKAELEVIAETAHRHGMPLFVDGARLGYGLTAAGTDVTLPDLARIADVFYIGGTKVGALFGEAVVFTKGNTPKHFLTQIKQHGALLAKGWLLGLQFGTLFTDDLYLRIAANANRQADRIREALRERGYTLTFEAPTNQVFVTLDHPTIERLQAHVRMGFMEKADNEHTVMRLCTSWATTDEQVDQLIALL